MQKSWDDMSKFGTENESQSLKISSRQLGLLHTLLWIAIRQPISLHAMRVRFGLVNMRGGFSIEVSTSFSVIQDHAKICDFYRMQSRTHETHLFFQNVVGRYLTKYTQE